MFVPLWTRTLTAPSTPRRMEAHQMPSPRWLARLAIPVAAGAALFTSAAIATADPTSDAYLAQLRAAGFTWPPDHDDALIGMAQFICDDLGWGFTPDRLSQDILSAMGPRGLCIGPGHST